MVSHVYDCVFLCVLSAFLMQSNQSLLNAQVIKWIVHVRLFGYVMHTFTLFYFDLRDIYSYVMIYI